MRIRGNLIRRAKETESNRIISLVENIFEFDLEEHLTKDKKFDSFVQGEIMKAFKRVGDKSVVDPSYIIVFEGVAQEERT